MNRLALRFGAFATLSIALSGCGVMRSLGLAPRLEHRQARTALAEAGSGLTSTILTRLGRAQLDEGNPGLAAATFRKALETGEPRAAALNGLGVAYARVGRNDLAGLHFRLAMEADPGNETYAANLAILLRSSGIERQASRSTQAQPALAPAARLAMDVPAPQPGKLVRLSAREFSISIAAPEKAPTNASRPRGGKAMVRLDLSRIPHKLGEPVADATAAGGAAPEDRP